MAENRTEDELLTEYMITCGSDEAMIKSHEVREAFKKTFGFAAYKLGTSFNDLSDTRKVEAVKLAHKILMNR